MSKNVLAFSGFVCALSFGGLESALKISLSTVCVLILSWLSVRIPFLFDEWINKVFIVSVWSAAAQIMLASFGTSQKDLLLCLAANLLVISVLSHDFKELLPSAGFIIVISVIIGWIPFVSSMAISFIIAGLATSLFSLLPFFENKSVKKRTATP